MLEKLKKIDKGTICRTILQVLAYINQIIAIFGQSSFASAMWYQVVTLVFTLITTAIGYWYNNDWTSLAILTRDIYDAVKGKKLDQKTVEHIIDIAKKEKEE